MNKLNRRAVLRGAGGIALGLPVLEAMGNSKFSGKPPVRTAFFYMPNGVGPASIWNPKNEGKDYHVHNSMAPLGPVKGFINVHGGLKTTHRCDHGRSASMFLTGQRPAQSNQLETKGISIDQLITKEIGDDCFLPSMELSVDRPDTSIDAQGNNKAHGAYLSWSSTTTPIPREINPHNAFKRIFKGTKSSSGGGNYTKSILDYIKDDANRLKRILGTEDNRKVNEYFYSIRQIERRLAKLGTSNKKLPSGTKAPDEDMKDRGERAKAMVDIMVLAFQTDRTRVATFALANGGSGTNYNFLPGVTQNHHATSHHGSKPENIKALTEINKYHLSFYVQMIKQMSVIQEDNGTLLDNSLIFFGNGLKDGQSHSFNDLPILVAGAGGGSVKTGYHHNHKGKNLNSLFLGMAKTAGCKMSSFVDEKSAII